MRSIISSSLSYYENTMHLSLLASRFYSDSMDEWTFFRQFVAISYSTGSDNIQHLKECETRRKEKNKSGKCETQQIMPSMRRDSKQPKGKVFKMDREFVCLGTKISRANTHTRKKNDNYSTDMNHWPSYNKIKQHFLTHFTRQ